MPLKKRSRPRASAQHKDLIKRGVVVRDKILSTAHELFYAEGIRAVGVDRIVAESGVAKASLYHWFSTKDDLIAEFLNHENARFWAYWDTVSAKYAGQPREELLAHIQWISGYIGGTKFRGCPFLNATAEFSNSAHPVRRICTANKAEMNRRITVLATQIGVQHPKQLGNQLTLLIDGALANSQVLGKTGPAAGLFGAAKMLLESHSRV